MTASNVRSALDYGEQIAQLRQQVRKEKEKEKERRQAYGARIAALEGRIDNLCDLQLGQAGAQVDLEVNAAAAALAERRHS
jgi:hypothetical protein